MTEVVDDDSPDLTPEQWRVFDRTLVMFGLIVIGEYLDDGTLLKSGYPPPVVRLMNKRIERLLAQMGVDKASMRKPSQESQARDVNPDKDSQAI